MAGLKTLYDGTKEASGLAGTTELVDIVAVHGLGANSDFAWVRKKRPEEGQFEDVNWLEILLPQSIPASRIRCFNYDSRWVGNNLPKQTLVDIARQLLDATFHSKSDADHPVIFIGHSFGGLIIEQALVLANSETATYPTVLKLTGGVVFLGTPHRGSAAQPWGKLITTCSIALGLPAEKALLDVLREDSLSLHELVHQFTAIVRQHSIPVKCFFELYETELGRRIPWLGSRVNLRNFDTMIVDKISGTIPGLEYLALQTDHFKINKFARLDDPNYLSVSNSVLEFAKSAISPEGSGSGAHVRTQGDQGLTSMQRECLEALFLTEPQDDRTKLINDKGERVPTTCEWITTHEKYLGWLRDPASRLLWISGGPGKGKTMLSIFLTEEISARVARSHDALLAYYFCDNQNENRRSGITILRALIYQILRQRPSLFRHILPDFEVQRKALFSASSAQETLWRMLRNMLLDPSSSSKTIIFAVIDGLDECERPSLDTFLKECRTLFSSASSQRQTSSATFKMILLSRGLPDCIPEELTGHDRIRLDPDSEQEVNRDLRCFIIERTEKLAQRKRYPQELRKRVEKKLLQRADGTFLWVAFVVRELESKSAAEVLDTLDSISSGLHAVYDRLLLQIHESRRAIASRVLRWIVIAARPLSVTELAAATGCKSSGGLGPQEIIRDHVGYCGALVQISVGGHVGLIHQSVKDYLLRATSGPDARLDLFRFNAEQLHAEITDRCLDYLYNGCLPTRRTADPQDPATAVFLEKFPFFPYAMRGWPHHAARSTQYDFSHPFFKDGSDIRTAWLRISWPWNDLLKKPSFWMPELEKGPPCTLLHLAAALGLCPLAQKLLSGSVRGSLYAYRHINQRDSEGLTPLEYAVRRHHVDLVHLLLRRRAKTEFQYRHKQTSSALHIAAVNGDEKMVKLLVRFVANVDSWSNYYCWYGDSTPLGLASRLGREGTARLLLEAGADVNPIPRHNQGVASVYTPLSQASIYGHESIVRLLLENKADVNSQDSSGHTALIKASVRSGPSVVRLLLENGAEVNTQNKFRHTALIGASILNNESTVRLLLDNGADIHIRDGRGQSALMVASSNNAESVVLLLLGNGADISVQDEEGISALMKASYMCHESLVRLLVENGAEIDAKDHHNNSALMLTLLKETWNYLHPEEELKKALDVILLLLKLGAATDIKNKDGDTALRLALKFKEEAVRLLLDNGADVNDQDSDGRSALMLASMKDNRLMVVILLQNGADIDAKDHQNNSALMLILQTSTLRSRVIELLLKNGATTDIKNKDGDTALSLALKNGTHEIVRLLREHGAIE